MSDFAVQVGSHSAQGLRSNNEDRFVADVEHQVFLVADGMGGQEFGELASGMAAEILPKLILQNLATKADPPEAVQKALAEANLAIIKAGQAQSAGRRMGTTAVLAVRQNDQFYVAGLGDSRAYLVRDNHVEQLTLDHTVADALERNGTLTAEQAKHSPWRNSLYKFLGCAEMRDGAEIRPFAPTIGDCLILASDGLTNFLTHDDLRTGRVEHPDPQEWAEFLVRLALQRGSRDNVTCVVVRFNPAQ